MKKIDSYIEIVRTTNAPFSSMYGVSSQKIQAILAKYYERVEISTLNNIADLELLTRKQPDLVFLGLKRLPSSWSYGRDTDQDIWLPEYLDNRGLAYTGSVKSAIALDFNKEAAKARVRQAGLATAASFTALPGQYAAEAELSLPLPLFVKPLNTGGGKGIGDDSVVRTFGEFQQKVESIFTQCTSPSLVETYLTGREFSVAILEDVAGGPPLVMPIEIITEENERGDRVLGSRVKHEDNETVIPVTDSHIRTAVCALATQVYDTLGARDLGRIDIRLDAAGVPSFLEANFMPDPGSRYFAGACEINEGMNYDQVLLTIVELGLARAANARDMTSRGVYLELKG